MKILAVSDLHNSDAGLEFILELIGNHKPELLLFCGDVTTFGPKSFARKAIMSFPVKTFGVPGNCDPLNVHQVYNEGNSKNLHGISVEHNGFQFIGWGGSNKSLNTPFENLESYIFDNLVPLFEKASENTKSPIIFVSHCPPHGFLDVVPGGQHVGCTSIAEIIDKYRPPLTVCGHIHEARGIFSDVERNLVIVNAGPSKLHNAALLDLETPEKVSNNPLDNIKIELLS